MYSYSFCVCNFMLYNQYVLNIIPDGAQLYGPDMEGVENGPIGKYSNL